MKELQSIIKAYDSYKSDGQKTALATVVQVDGSAYRRPGARMLITESGQLTGAISGGCLEGDALRKAQSVIFQQKSMLVTYDTTDEDDQKFGVGLGCNGIIHVLIEPIVYEDFMNPVELLKAALTDRKPAVLCTIFSVKNSKSEQIGTVVLKKPDQIMGKIESMDSSVWKTIQATLPQLQEEGHKILTYTALDELQVFFESIRPSIRILLFGAGNDTIPVADIADIMGWEVYLIDGRKSLTTYVRFPKVKKMINGSATEVIGSLDHDPYTVALLMTHNFEYEAVILEHILSFNLPYIGILGPKKKSEKLMERLEGKGIAIPHDTLYSPMGLDIGAEGSEEIALSALAEIKTVLSARPGTFLREKEGPIHQLD